MTPSADNKTVKAATNPLDLAVANAYNQATWGQARRYTGAVAIGSLPDIRRGDV